MVSNGRLNFKFVIFKTPPRQEKKNWVRCLSSIQLFQQTPLSNQFSRLQTPKVLTTHPPQSTLNCRYFMTSQLFCTFMWDFNYNVIIALRYFFTMQPQNLLQLKNSDSCFMQMRAWDGGIGFLW
jgi:hypothetical protein